MMGQESGGLILIAEGTIFLPEKNKKDTESLLLRKVIQSFPQVFPCCFDQMPDTIVPAQNLVLCVLIILHHISKPVGGRTMGKKSLNEVGVFFRMVVHPDFKRYPITLEALCTKGLLYHKS